MLPKATLRRRRAYRRLLPTATAALILGGLLVGALASTALSATLGDITEFPVPTAAGQPNGITSGPDGNVWFTEFGGSANKVSRITTSGVVTEYSLPTPNAGPRGIAADTGDFVYFTEWTANKIGRINTNTAAVTEFSIPTAGSQPDGIVFNPTDGNVWFTESAGNKIGKLIPGSGTVLEFPVPTANSQPSAITVDASGNLWFTENNANKIGKMTTAGVFTEYTIPTANSQPNGIALGPDGNLWFTENNTDKLAKVTPGGAFTEFPLPAGSAPTGITTGADGNLWFNEAGTNNVARSTTAGGINEWSIPAASSVATGITSGPDLNLWFTEYGTNMIGRLEAAANLTVTKTAIAGGSGTVTSAPAGIACGPTCSQRFMEGTSITLTAAPDPGSRFVGFTGDCVSAVTTCTFTRNENTTIVATFQKTWDLDVTNAGLSGGSGTITSAPVGINCGGTCSATYDHGTAVVLTPVADVGSRFLGWTGDCAGTGACNLTMSADRAAIGTFVQTHDLTATSVGSLDGSGTISSTPAGINCGVTCVHAFNEGTMVALTATPSAGSRFVGWSGDCAGVGACNVTMDGVHAVTATFLKTYTLTVTKSGTGAGSVTSSPVGINCGATCAATLDASTVVTLSGLPGGTSTFTGWGAPCAGTGTCVVTMNANVTVNADFTEVVQPAALSIHGPSKVRAGTRVRISGVLTSPSPACTSGQQMLLEKNDTILGPRTTSATGDYAFETKVREKTLFRAIFPGTSSCAEAISIIVRVRII